MTRSSQAAFIPQLPCLKQPFLIRQTNRRNIFPPFTIENNTKAEGQSTNHSYQALRNFAREEELKIKSITLAEPPAIGVFFPQIHPRKRPRCRLAARKKKEASARDERLIYMSCRRDDNARAGEESCPSASEN